MVDDCPKMIPNPLIWTSAIASEAEVVVEADDSATDGDGSGGGNGGIGEDGDPVMVGGFIVGGNGEGLRGRSGGGTEIEGEAGGTEVEGGAEGTEVGRGAGGGGDESDVEETRRGTFWVPPSENPTEDKR